MTYEVKSAISDHENENANSRYAKNKSDGSEEENSRYAKYTEAELIERLGHITVITYAKNGNPDIIEAQVEWLGYSHEAREINDDHVEGLIASDESTWEPLKVCFWPDYKDKPSEETKLRLIGGNHRTKASKGKNPPLETLRVKVGKVADEVDFLEAQIEDNASHGLGYTLDQRKALALKLREMKVPVSRIANRLKVPEKTLYNWFSNRNTNKNKKEKVHEREQIEGILANLGIEELEKDWQNIVPEVTADARQLANVGQTISNFLAETPTAERKGCVVAWIMSLPKEARHSYADDMRETIQWLTNISTLLKSDKLGDSNA